MTLLEVHESELKVRFRNHELSMKTNKKPVNITEVRNTFFRQIQEK